MAKDALPAHVQALQRKRAYPGPVQSIDLVQTHISYVFLVDGDVYKLKKPVNMGFADFTTLEKRRSACEAEVRLNRRGSPVGVYHGVLPITQDASGYHLNGAGETIDYAVHMKRLPQDRMMDEILGRGEVDFDMVGRVAARLRDLHESAERGPEVSARGGARALREDWADNLEGIRPYIGRTLSRQRFERIERFALAELEREAGLMAVREDEGWVRDCHGDLRSDSVCFDDSVPGGICIYDCIEFNERFRSIDTALDAAFLAMDLDYRGHPELSDLFIGLYAAAIGDSRLPLLLHFYKAYRATVRGKVESFLLDDAGIAPAQKAKARGRARAYFKLAEQYARRRPIRGLVLVTGPSGSGKSVLGGAIAARLGAALLSTDIQRLKMYGRREGEKDALAAGRYTDEAREQVYVALEEQARTFLGEGRAVVVDGTYLTADRRAPIVAVARDAGVPFLLIECSVPDEVVRRRQEARQGQAWSTSEGNYEVYQAQKGQMEPAAELPETARLAIDTTTPLAEQIEAVTARLSV